MKRKIQNTILLIVVFIILSTNVIFATGFLSFKLFTGTQNLLRDLTTALLIIFPVACGICILFFQLMKICADTQEQSLWTKRTKGVIKAAIIGESASGIINLICAYYSG